MLGRKDEVAAMNAWAELPDWLRDAAKGLHVPRLETAADEIERLRKAIWDIGCFRRNPTAYTGTDEDEAITAALKLVERYEG